MAKTKNREPIELGEVPALLRMTRCDTPRSSGEREPVNQVSVSGDRLDIMVQGVIGGFFGDVDTVAILEALQENPDVAEINVSINSPGGVVSDSVAIYNALVQHKAKVNVNVMGFAYSGASIIAMAGDDIAIAGNATMMIHNAMIVAIGNSDEMRETADFLDKVDVGLAATYAARAGKPAKEIVNLMADTTFFTADEAVDMGLADRKLVLKGKQAKQAKAQERQDVHGALWDAMRPAALAIPTKVNVSAGSAENQKEPIMAEMTLQDLKDMFSDASAEFYVECLDAKCDAVAASKRYATKIKAAADARQKASDEALAASQAEIEKIRAEADDAKATNRRPGNESLGGGGSSESENEGGDPIAIYESKVRELMAGGVARADACDSVSIRNPELLQRYMAATNASKGVLVGRKIADKFE